MIESSYVSRCYRSLLYIGRLIHAIAVAYEYLSLEDNWTGLMQGPVSIAALDNSSEVINYPGWLDEPLNVHDYLRYVMSLCPTEPAGATKISWN